MNHIYLIRLVLLKRPGFQSQKYGMPSVGKHLGLDPTSEVGGGRSQLHLFGNSSAP